MPNLSLTLAQPGAAGWTASQIVAVVAAVGVGIVLLIMLAAMGQFLNLWVQALTSGAKVDFVELVGMKLRKVDPRVVVLARIRAYRAGVDIPAAQLESHYLAGGRVPDVVTAMILAHNAGLELSWQDLCAGDLAGHDVLEEVGALAKAKPVLPSGRPSASSPQ